VSWFTNSVKLSTKLCFNAVITKILTGKRFLYDFHQTNFCSITTLFRTKYHFWPSAKEAIKKIMKCLQHKPSIPIYSFCLESHFGFCHITIFQCWKCDEIEGLFVFPYLVKYFRCVSICRYVHIYQMARKGRILQPIEFIKTKCNNCLSFIVEFILAWSLTHKYFRLCIFVPWVLMQTTIVPKERQKIFTR